MKIAPAGSKPDPQALYEAIYSCVEQNIERFARGKPYDQVTADYLSIAREDGAGYPKELSFGFMDGAGLCSMSSDACCHWFRVLVAALRKPIEALAREHDLKITSKPESLAALLKRCDAPLIELRGNLFATGELHGEVYITSDDLDEETLAIEDLTAKERARVEKAFAKKRCDCKVCAALRAKKKLVLPKKKSKAKPPPSSFKTNLSGTHRNIVDEDNSSKISSVPIDLLAPKTLESIGIRLPAITTLPDELASLRSLRRVSWYHTKITRLPEVLTRMPWLEDLSISEGELDGFDDIAKLPNLKRLRLASLKKVGKRLPDFPVDVLAALEHLVVSNCEADTLPAGIGRLAKLVSLDVSSNAIRVLPRALGALSSLESLYAGSDSLVCIEEGALPKGLTYLGLDFSYALEALPESIGSLESLESIFVAGAKLERLPEGMRKLRKLKTLRLDDNARLVLPEWLGELRSLEQLSLNRVPMTELPKGIRKMRSLAQLTLEHTNVFPLPDWIGELPLEFLSLRGEDLPRGERARLARLLPKTDIRVS